ncbi:MAG: hypothetical protein V2I54_09715 [Bacteroidales bacterium]|jgi:hypothetical protein|nr:hypothetical protein [Bacteroidales bacterium]
MELKSKKTLTVLVVLLAVSLTVVSYLGAFYPLTYVRDSASMGAQGIGQDLVDLFFVVPVLLISLWAGLKNNRMGLFVLAGTLFYILYSFIIYAFGVHFNQLFLLYCSTLGLSVFAFWVLMLELNHQDIKSWFNPSGITKTIGIYFIIVATMFYLLWFKDLVPAILSNTVPDLVSDNDLLVNPVHVIDIAFALPGLIVVAFLLFKKHQLGYIFAPVGLVFTIILTIALIGMVVMLKVKDISDDSSVAGIFLFLSAISTILLVLFFRTMKKNK